MMTSISVIVSGQCDHVTPARAIVVGVTGCGDGGGGCGRDSCTQL